MKASTTNRGGRRHSVAFFATRHFAPVLSPRCFKETLMFWQHLQELFVVFPGTVYQRQFVSCRGTPNAPLPQNLTARPPFPSIEGDRYARLL